MQRTSWLIFILCLALALSSPVMASEAPSGHPTPPDNPPVSDAGPAPVDLNTWGTHTLQLGEDLNCLANVAAWPWRPSPQPTGC